MKKYILAASLAISTMMTVPVAHAQLAVDRIIVDFTAEESHQNDVKLTNTSETETLYISVEVLEVDHPGTEKETRIIADDPSKIGLIASPGKVILPPGSQRLVRLVNLFPAEDKERIFRVNFSPVAGETEQEGNSVKIMVGYQALVIVRPTESTFDLEGKREGNKLILTNNGNTNVYLDSAQQCTSDKPEDCTQLPQNRLYPGNVWELELEGSAPVTLNAFNGTEFKSMKF